MLKKITLEIAKTLARGIVLYDTRWHNTDGSPARWRVNGQVKTWKRNPARVRVPLKHGLYDYGYLDETNLARFEVRP